MYGSTLLQSVSVELPIIAKQNNYVYWNFENRNIIKYMFVYISVLKQNKNILGILFNINFKILYKVITFIQRNVW